MNPNLYIPACHKFIHKKDGTPDYQRIYGVTKSAYLTKYPDKKLSAIDLLKFLQLNHIIPAEDHGIDLDHQELCFSIISQYKCNSICQLCPYSPLYKNIYENEEAFVLGYAMNNWEHLRALKETGITCRHFRSMIPVSQQSTVLVVPLNRLAFEYLETVPQSQNDLLSIADKIIATLKKNNKDKLSAADIKIAHKYLLNLSDKSYQNLDPEKIDCILKKCFQLTLKQDNNQQDAKTLTASNLAENDRKKILASNNSPDKPSTIADTTCLEGFLAGKTTAPAVKKPSPKSVLTENQPTRIISKGPAKTEPPKKPEGPVISNPPSAISLQHKSVQSEHLQPAIPKRIVSTYTKPSDKPKSVKENFLERYPQIWSITPQELSDFHVTDLDKADSLQIELFLWNLLQTPLLPTEIALCNKNRLVIVFARQKFYRFSVTNSLIIDKILPYINRSRYRKLICFEPYMLYNFFIHQDIHSVQIFSLRLAADFTEAKHDWGLAPEELIQNTTCTEQISGVLDAMLQYYKMYRTLYEKLQNLTDDIRAAYLDKLNIAHVIGKSFLLATYCDSSNYLIRKETIFGYEFTFSGSEKMKPAYTAISYRFSWEEKQHFPVWDLLSILSSRSILEQYMISLLAVSENEIIFATTPVEYNFLCDLINKLCGFYVKTKKTSPISIDETILSDKLE